MPGVLNKMKRTLIYTPWVRSELAASSCFELAATSELKRR